jgi:hypothetical protein
MPLEAASSGSHSGLVERCVRLPEKVGCRTGRSALSAPAIRKLTAIRFRTLAVP